MAPHLHRRRFLAPVRISNTCNQPINSEEPLRPCTILSHIWFYVTDVKFSVANMVASPLRMDPLGGSWCPVPSGCYHLPSRKKEKRRKLKHRDGDDRSEGLTSLCHCASISSCLAFLPPFTFRFCHLSLSKDSLHYSSLCVCSPVIILKCDIYVKSYIVLQCILSSLSLSLSKSHSRNRKKKKRSGLAWLAIIMYTSASPLAQEPSKGMVPFNAFETIQENQRNHFHSYLYNQTPIDQCR